MIIMAPTNHQPWKPVTAIVTSVEAKDGQSRTLETDDNPERTFYLIHFRYTVDEQTYTGDFESRSPIDQGRTVEVLYNPDNPQQNSTSKPTPTLINRIIFYAITVTLVALLLYLAFLFKART